MNILFTDNKNTLIIFRLKIIFFVIVNIVYAWVATDLGETMNSKPTWRGLDSVRLACLGNTTASATAVRVVALRP